MGIGAAEALILLLIGGVCAGGPLVIIIVFVVLLRQGQAYATPEGRAKGRATLLPWSPSAFTDFAAELDASWLRGRGGTTLSGRVLSLSQPARAWALLHVEKRTRFQGEVTLCTSLTELVLVVRDARVEVTQNGAPLGSVRLDRGELVDPAGVVVATLGPAGGSGPASLLPVPLGAMGFSSARVPRQFEREGVALARIATWKSGDPATPLVQVAGTLPGGAEPWLLVAVALEMGWFGADQPRRAR